MIVCTWFWGDKYDPIYVQKLAAGVKRNLKQPHRFMVFPNSLLGISDGYMTVHASWKHFDLMKIKGCFIRLQMFDQKWQRLNGIEAGERIVNIDVDSVITGPLDPLFNLST